MKQVSKKFIQAGKKNLSVWNEKVEKGEALPGSVKHGAYTQHFRKRYSDARTREGKRLRAFMTDLVDQLGGESEIGAEERGYLDGIWTRQIIIYQIKDYLDRQPNIINGSGEVLRCIKTLQDCLKEQDKARSDMFARLEEKRKNKKPILLDEYLSKNYGGKQ